MEIEYKYLKRTTIEKFADEYGLVMEVYERPQRSIQERGLKRFYAHFKSAEIKDGSCLAGVSGDGNTPETAIEEYARKIEERLLVIDAMQPSRREIEVPILTRPLEGR